MGLRAGLIAAVATALVLTCVVVFTQDRRATVAPQEAPPPPAPKPRSDQPLVVLSGNEHGFIRPCGCSKPALGGVHRRAHAIADLRTTEPRLAPVALGEFLNETGRQQELKFEALMMSLNEMKYAAFVPGAGEFRLGVRSFSDTRAMTQVPFVAANASLPGEEPFPKSATLADTGGVLVGLVGPAAAAYGVTLTAAADALRDEIPGHAEAAFVIVAYTGPAADVPALAAVVPEAMRAKTTFVVPGDSDGPMALEPALSMPVVTTGMKGRSIGLLRPLSGKPYEAMRLEEDRPGTPEVNMILDSYRTIVHDEGLMKNVGRTPAVAGYVGDKKCAECHQEAYDKLFTTPHQRAIKSLKTTRDEFDPECVRCHVTGWATEGGFVDYETTPAHMNVNCEACHGPGQAHAAKPSEVPTPAGKVDATTCVRCHDPDNSPQFKFEKYWPRIEHR